MKIICVGRNYSEHAKELNNDLPIEPVIFMKAKNALLPHDKPFYYPEFTEDLHFECEVVYKICKNGRYVQARFADKYYDEVGLGIDFTARDLQRQQQAKGLPWEIAKAFDSSAAIGEFLAVTPEMKVNELNFQLKHNGTVVQDGHTKDMIFPIDKIIEYVSKFFTLNIGDLIFTGTPAGVGPVSVGDRLEGFFEGRKLLDVDIK
jgi:2-keto-4-pentenoate hydratase/2-oxohepta-3-ene-1,7-dioic acid hydratase in catechol pathway